jgi:hypothetical protein
VNQLEDLGEQLEEMNVSPNIKVKYYQEFIKIYQTSFKLCTEIRKQFKTKEGLSCRVAAIDVYLTII